MDRVNDLVEFRIDGVLQEMSSSILCVLPEDEPVSCDEFVKTTRVKTNYICLHDRKHYHCTVIILSLSNGTVHVFMSV